VIGNAAIAWIVAMLLPVSSVAGSPPELASAAVEERFGQGFPVDARFTDHTGRAVRLGAFIRDDRPLLLLLAYYHCPMLCPLDLHGAAEAMRGARHRLGRDFRAVTLSFDPEDRPADALRMRASALGSLDDRDGGWPFLVGAAPEVLRVTRAVGFAFRRDPTNGQFAHSAVAVVLTADGRVSGYLYGVPFTASELDAAIDLAARGGAGRHWSDIVLQCFHWIPALRRHAGVIAVVCRGGALVILASFLAAVFVGVRHIRSRGTPT
jgi:protein SCO1/2